MKHGYVLTEEQGTGSFTWDRTRARVEVTGDVTDLTEGLRTWAIETATREQYDDGRYSAYLVELDANSRYDTHNALAFEEILWFYGQEHVPAS
ncbi:hypothetical protein [Actinophytocola glycyrrhizae]|uniref:Uncharacterized protein n=1 Tax=Actinophytocola glycyrrhizae TaxID=2044873 RepID=A0ABV9RTG8_9PSEU